MLGVYDLVEILAKLSLSWLFLKTLRFLNIILVLGGLNEERVSIENDSQLQFNLEI